ncbi:PcfK-like family protein [Alistipes putredinis]|uniref:PcfK-like family protein n=1 Tax=Alistipes putredinis TaxID=28117 RepID=UPI003A920279
MAQENKATDYFKQTIQSYLQRRAQEDELFAPRYANPKKNIDDCITFILNYVKQSGCNGFADDEIYSLAMHYYDEDDIDIGKPLANCKVVVNHTIELTEEEKAEAHSKAMQRATDEAYRRITQGKNKTKKTETATQSSLF